jgi:hypothetical protein
METDESGLKSIIIYPMKTLEVDQLNRFIRYLDRINRDLKGDKIKIGIWDGDTKDSVGVADFQAESGSYVRGLECPRTGDKLRLKSDFNVVSDDYEYPWIRATRKGIRSGVDILLTNPEALDNIFVNDKAETRSVVGNEPSDHPVQHIVYDEAHVWSGIKGASISLLSKRLKEFYAERDPQITMVSATVDNPSSLAASLTGAEDKDKIHEIKFTEEEVPVRGDPDFSRIQPCTLDEIVHTLLLASSGSKTTDEVLTEKPELENAVSTLQEVEILESGNTLRIQPNVADWLLPPIDKTVTSLCNTDAYSDTEAVASSAEGREQVINRVLNSGNIASNWKRHASQNIPEVATLAKLFTDDSESIQFRKYDELVDAVAGEDVSNPGGVLSTVILLGRLGKILTDKYHLFLKPPSKAYWCEACELISRRDICHECGSTIPELQFCKNCHHPFVAEELDDETVFVPLNAPQTGHCPGCGESPRLQDINVPTSTLLTFMLTELCRLTPTKKTLVFSDSRSSAETVGGEIINTEYGLVAESLYVKELLEEGGTAPSSEVYFNVSDTLKEKYWQPLKENAIDEEGATYEILEELRSNIQSKASFQNCRHLTPAAIVTSDFIYDLEDATALAIGHEVFDIFARDPNAGFQRNGIKLQGLTYDRLKNKLTNRLQLDETSIDNYLDRVLSLLVDEGFIHQPPWDEIEQRVQDKGENADDIDETLTYLEKERDSLGSRGHFDEDVKSGVFTRDIQEDESILRLVPRVSYCLNCYSVYPAPEEGPLSNCPTCGSDVGTYQRFEVSDGEYTGQGYANIDSGWQFELDHWANDITGPVTSDELEFISAGIHKGDIPASLRGAIEEAFRKPDPDVNIVSATPTMELGVDIGSLESVTQVGIPPTLTNYVQRSGRTGRSRGSSSLVSTVIRGEHPVDNHYYSNLDSFFSGFKPVRVPDPENYDEIMAGHVFTETLAYLARNPDPKQIFERIYSLNESALDLNSYQSEVRKRFSLLQKLVDDDPERTDVTNHIQSIFGDRGVEIFEQVFFEDGPISLERRTQRTFESLTSISGSSKAVTSLTEQYQRLDRWGNLLGYVGNYRGFGNSFPIKVSGRNEDDIQFKTAGRLFEVFPGPENGPGATFRLQGSKYIITDVHGSPNELLTTGVCSNEECDRPFGSYNLSREVCPHCEQPLTETTVHPIGSVTCERALGGRRLFSTRPISSLEIDQTDQHEIQPETVFGMDCDISVGDFDVTEFIYAFEQFHSRRSEPKTLLSQATIDKDPEPETDFDEASIDDLLEDVDQTKYRPIGQQYHTRGMRLRFDRDTFKGRFDAFAKENADAMWPQALVSLEQAVKKSVAIIAECDQDDFSVKAADTGSEIDVYIIDGQEGGNGITWQVYKSIEESTELDREVSQVASCTNCSQYCDGCLLLERTPAFYLENDLLNKHSLRAIIDLGRPVDHSTSTEEASGD